MAKKKVEVKGEVDVKLPVVNGGAETQGDKTAKEKCEADHKDEEGYCDDQGGWHPSA